MSITKCNGVVMGNFLVQSTEEFYKLLMSMPLIALADDPAL